MHAQVAEALDGATPSSSTSLWGRFWNQVKNAINGKSITAEVPPSADALLAKFNEIGLLALRSPGLGENYSDHTVVVFSVSKINVPGKKPKIVAGIIDCNDQALCVREFF